MLTGGSLLCIDTIFEKAAELLMGVALALGAACLATTANSPARLWLSGPATATSTASGSKGASVSGAGAGCF